MNNRNILLVDGTRLFFAARAVSPQKTLNYEDLDEVLLDFFKANYHWDEAILYSTFDPKNEKQVRFLDFIENKIQWKVQRAHVADVDPMGLEDSGDVKSRLRFDAHISQKLGRLGQSVRGEEIVNVCIVSDSYPLLPISRGVEELDIKFAFFSRVADKRWKRQMREIDYLDLEDHYERLFEGEDS